MEVRTALSVRAPRVSRRGTAEKAYGDIIGPGFGASGRHARWVETRERALASARDAPSPWLQEFNCRHGYSPGASNRGEAMPIDGPFIADAIQPPRKSRNTHSTAHPVTEKLSLKIHNLRTEGHY